MNSQQKWNEFFRSLRSIPRVLRGSRPEGAIRFMALATGYYHDLHPSWSLIASILIAERLTGKPVSVRYPGRAVRRLP